MPRYIGTHSVMTVFTGFDDDVPEFTVRGSSLSASEAFEAARRHWPSIFPNRPVPDSGNSELVADDTWNVRFPVPVAPKHRIYLVPTRGLSDDDVVLL